MREATREVIRLMIKAGFIRKEFKAAVDRDPSSRHVEITVGSRWNGKRFIQPNELIEKRLKALLSVGLGVERTKHTDGMMTLRILTDRRFRGQLVDIWGSHEAAAVEQGGF